MAVEYDIKAKPTVYGERRFRSRLEAKWASFFDLCGWPFEYEPFDLGAWSPDFLLLGYRKVLVEVKPITKIDNDVTDKMIRAARAAEWEGDLLLVGVAPLFDMNHGPYESAAIGWLGERCFSSGENSTYSYSSKEDAPDDAVLDWGFGRASVCDNGGEVPDFMHDDWSYFGRMFGCGFKDVDWPEDVRWLKSRWDRAANRVQWHKK